MNYRKHNSIGCAFCRNCSKLHPKDYRFNQWAFHVMKDGHGNLLCPMLKNLKCTDCGEPGHTPRYCTNKQTFTLARYLSSSLNATQSEDMVKNKENMESEDNIESKENKENKENKESEEKEAERLRAEFAEADDLLWQYVDTVLLYCLDAPPQYAEWAWNKGVLLDWKARPHQANFMRNVY